MKIIFNQQIGIFENIFSKEYCDHIIKTYHQNQKHSMTRPILGNNNNFQDESLGVHKFLDKKNLDIFYDNLYKVINLYIENYKALHDHTTLGFIIADFKCQLTKPSEGYHKWHSEYSPSKYYNTRWGVWTLYLNDIEDGGETEFLYQSIRVKPKTGTVCIFPAYYTHTHRGNPPLKNNKYIATGWILYPEKYIQSVDEGTQNIFNEVKKNKKKLKSYES
tara:strand:- start:510 stop:1166 length:657 start_codon:yes stop_codon:yes gene_type:complete